MRAFWVWAAKGAASGLFLSYPVVRLRIGPWKNHTGAGLVGSLWGVVCAPLLPGEPTRAFLILLGVVAVSVAVSDAAEEAMGFHDDPRIVIDEWAGYLCAVAFLPQTPLVLIGAFILFRVFDVIKPGPIRALARLPGGWGVVMDDVLAGLMANGCIRLVGLFYPL